MKRGRFVAGVATGAAGVAVTRSQTRAAQYQFKLGHPWPEKYMTAVRLSDMAQAIGTESGGRLDVQVFANSSLGSQEAQVGQVRLGATQLLAMNHSVYSTVVPVAQISAVGFAFRNRQVPLDALDGALGVYVRKEFASKGLYVFEKSFDHEFRQVTTSTKPIRTVDDFSGLKIRTLPAVIYVELFKALGAAPAPIDSKEQYLSMQTHIVDAQEGGMDIVESGKFYEVQKYLSITNHIWGGAWLVANTESLRALPPDLQSIVERNASKFALLQRADALKLTDSLAENLKRQGLVFNTADQAGMRPRLSAYYARWKSEFGNTAWSLLEAKTGKLG